MAEAKTALLLHKDVVFQDQVLYTTGHAYHGCTFRRCTLFYRGGPGVFDTCTFQGVIWHLDVLIHDSNQWDEFMANVASAVTKSLPKAE